MSFLDVHRVTPLLGEPGLSIRPDSFTLVSEADGRTALAVIRRAALQPRVLWEVGVPAGIGVSSPPSRIVEGWAEAMTAAVELAALTRAFLDAAGQRYEAESLIRDWQHRDTLAQTSSTG